MNSTRTKGFTIIEVVLVLAIAGLIFLMVFIALPALQRGQRDTGRKNDVSTVASAVNTYRANNKGSFTGLSSATLQGNIDALSEFAKTDVTVNTLNPATTTATVTGIQVFPTRKCGTITAASVALAAGPTRGAAIVVGLENNGSTVQGYCQDV